jgi:hypothetical protein
MIYLDLLKLKYIIQKIAKLFGGKFMELFSCKHSKYSKSVL